MSLLAAFFWCSNREGLKLIMQEAYTWMDGMEPLLRCLKDHGVEMHAFTNYPLWSVVLTQYPGPLPSDPPTAFVSPCRALLFLCCCCTVLPDS